MNLSPSEQSEVTRFGIHDDEILQELENHADDVVPCGVHGCGKTIAWRVSMRCCWAAAEFCDHHGKRAIAKMRARLRTTSRSRRYARERGWPVPMDWEAVDNAFDRPVPVRRSAA